MKPFGTVQGRPLPHGGRLDEAVAAHGGPRSAWLDLSTGINPTRYPVPDVPDAVWHRLPEGALENEVRAAARAAYAAPNAAVSLAPGSQMHIQLLPFLHAPQPVAVIGPTYSEHAAAWARAGHEVLAADGVATAEASARIVVVVNPNNPTGRVIDPTLLRNLARRLGARGGLLVVDEAFADVAPEASVASHTGREGLVVLRSLGKFFGLAGARLGFALASPATAARLDDLLGPWAASGPALFAARAALCDRVWIRRTRRRLSERRAELERVLRPHVSLRGGTDLFVLGQHAEVSRLNERLLHHRILARTFRHDPTLVRFGIPGGQRPLARLEAALADR